MRMNEAEKKAAALPPKLTVPMILFFLPVLFVVILGPTGIKISELHWPARRRDGGPSSRIAPHASCSASGARFTR